MGGEFGPPVVVPALIDCLHRSTSTEALLYGDQQAIEKQLADCENASVLSRLTVIHCSEIITDSDKPSVAVRSKREASMGRAVKAVADQNADACISAGNTGALMALGLFTLKTLPGISRPAICTTFPTVRGRTYVLDLGANIECSADQLYQFAVLAHLTAQRLDKNVNPSIRLLNLGVEETKGSDELQNAAGLLEQDASLNYAGFVEGDGIFEGLADIVVCDGFSGNIALKTSEGFASMIAALLEDLFSKSWLARVSLSLVSRSFKDLKTKLDPALYNGAYLLGLNGVIVKSHGSASTKAFGHALDVAISAAENNLPKALAPLLQTKLMSLSKE
jgi:glycerol-3-phosphate acyltransferase PlsX